MNNESPKNELTLECFLTAGETDAQGRMPLWLIVSRLIEAATLHANSLGVGYADLIELGIGWVLTRLSIEMERYPEINEKYSITTWVEGYNRLFSDRCFLIADQDGKPVGHIRSMWVAIDITKRTASDLTQLDPTKFLLSPRKCPVVSPHKQKPLGEDAEETAYTFRFCDLDFNRHVNTVQYVKHILNQWSLEKYDTYEIGRFDIAFHNECHYGETALIRHRDTDDISQCEIVGQEGRHAVLAAIKWRPRQA